MSPDEDDQHRRRDDESMPVVLHRLGELEHRVENGFKESAASIRGIDRKLDNLAFVRADVYAVERAALLDRVAVLEKKLETGGEVEQDIDAAASPGKWALNLMITAFVVAMIGGLVGLALQAGG